MSTSAASAVFTPLTDEEFKKNGIKAGENGIAVLDFWAPWCGPCKVLEPGLQEAQKAHSDIAFYSVDVGSQKRDGNEALQELCGAWTLPNTTILYHGRPLFRHIGLADPDSPENSQAELRQWFDKSLAAIAIHGDRFYPEKDRQITRDPSLPAEIAFQSAGAWDILLAIRNGELNPKDLTLSQSYVLREALQSYDKTMYAVNGIDGHGAAAGLDANGAIWVSKDAYYREHGGKDGGVASDVALGSRVVPESARRLDEWLGLMKQSEAIVRDVGVRVAELSGQSGAAPQAAANHSPEEFAKLLTREQLNALERFTRMQIEGGYNPVQFFAYLNPEKVSSGKSNPFRFNWKEKQYIGGPGNIQAAVVTGVDKDDRFWIGVNDPHAMRKVFYEEGVYEGKPYVRNGIDMQSGSFFVDPKTGALTPRPLRDLPDPKPEPAPESAQQQSMLLGMPDTWLPESAGMSNMSSARAAVSKQKAPFRA